jgi:DNA-binding transcriptional ArsR family regulator
MKRKYNNISQVFHGSLARIIDAIMDAKFPEVSVTEMKNGSKLSYRTLLRDIPKLEDLGIIVNTRAVGRMKLYKLNMGSGAVDGLIRFRMSIQKL